MIFRRALLWLLRVVVVALALVLVSLVVLETGWFKEKLRGLAVTRTARFLNGELSIGRIDGSLLRGVTLERVIFAQSGKTVFSADRITVKYDPVVLARRKLVLDDIAIERLVLHAIEGPDGWNLAHLMKSTGTRSAPIGVTIRHLTIANGDITVTPQRGAERHISAVAMEGDLQRTGDRLQVVVARLTARDDRSGYFIRELSGQLENGLDRFDARFMADREDARLRGRVFGSRDSSGRQFDVDVDVQRLDVATILDNASWTTNVTGHAIAHALMPPTGETTWDFTFEGPHAEGWGYSAAGVRAKGRVTGSRLTFDASGSGYGAFASIGATWQWAAARGRPAGFSGRGRFQNVDLRRLPDRLSLPDFESRLAGRFAVSTAASRWSADVTLEPSAFEGASIDAGTIGHFEMTNGVPRYWGIGHVTGLDVRRLSGPLDLPVLASARFESRVTGFFTASGRDTTPEKRFLVASVQLEDSTMAAAHFDQVVASVTLAGQRLGVDAHAEFQNVSSALLGLPDRLQVGANGLADGLVVFRDLSQPATIENVDVAGAITLGASTVNGIEITHATAEAILRDGIATIANATAENATGRAEAAGTLALGATGESSLVVKADSEDLTALGEQLTQPLMGAAHLEATITGPANHPVAQGQLNGRQLAYGPTYSALTVNTTFTADMPERRFDQLTVKSETESTFVKAGEFDILRMTAKANFHADELELDARLDQAHRSVDVAGLIALLPEERTLRLNRLGISTAGLTWSLPPGGSALVRLDDAQVSVADLALVHDAQRIDINGTLALRDDAARPGDPALVLKIQQVNVAEVNRLLLGTRPVEGIANGEATVRGSAANPLVHASFNVTQGAVAGARFESFTGRADVDRTRATVDVALTQTADLKLTAAGTVPLRAAGATDWPDGMDLRIRSESLNLAFAQILTSEIEHVAGTGQLDLHLTGSVSAPLVNGTVALADGAFTIPATGVSYRGLNGALTLDGNHLRIGQMQIDDGDGHVLRLEGAVDVLGQFETRALDMHITGSSFHVLRNRLGDVQLDIDVTARGGFAAPRIEGTLRVDQGRLEVDQVLAQTTRGVYNTESQATLEAQATEEPAAPGFFDRLSLALKLRLPDNFVMRGRDMRIGNSSMGLGNINIIAGGLLDVQKPAGGRVSVLGDVQVIRGFYQFQGRRFEVERGSEVRFRGLTPIDPALDVSAAQDISGVSTRVRLRGSARNPQLSLSSQPPLDDADILSLIVFGQPVNELGTTQRSSLAEKAGAFAAGAITAPIADSVARALNLDLFEIQPPANGEAPAVAIGSQIGSRIYVGLRQEISGLDASTVSFEYRITHFLRLITSVAQGALQQHALRRTEMGGIDLIFVFRY